MNRKQWLGAACAALAVVSCGPMTVEPALTVTAAPRTVRNDGQRTAISISGTDNTGKPGTGNVRVRSAAGSLKDGATVQLMNGTGEVDFTCNQASDADCRPGSVRITAEWTTNMKLVDSSVTVTLSQAVDAGTGGGGAGGGTAGGGSAGGGSAVDAGTDAGTGDAGSADAGPDAGMYLDAGTFDGGVFGMYRLEVVTIEKPTILAGVSDETDITFRLTHNTGSMLPAAGRTVMLTADRGASFSSMMVAGTAARMTDATGQFTVTVYSGNTTPGTITLQASADDARVSIPIRVVAVATAEWVNDSTTRTTLTIQRTNMLNSTPIFFRVRDGAGATVEGVEVEFSMLANSAAGCSVSPLRDRSNNMGLARTTLTTGNSAGTATVVAKVLGIPDTNSTGIQVTIGFVNEGRMQFSCNRATLGALQSPTPPRTDQSSLCTVGLSDRTGTAIPFGIDVSFLSEAGTVPLNTRLTPNAMSVGMTFSSLGPVPVETTPLPAVGPPFSAPAEPFSGSRNPRDNFVTIVAAVRGEEQFFDGSGASNNVANGQWDPGEYWVDQPEPFVDANDNGTWDPGEEFIDTQRVNCATGMVEAPNQRWDRGNGCWDGDATIWKTTHIVYSGGPAMASADTLRFSPALPTFVANNAVVQVDVSWTDLWFNRFSSDSAQISVATISGTRGTATIASSSITGESFCHDLRYFAMRVRVNDAGVVLAEEGDCNITEPDSGYPDVRCIRTYKFRDWRSTPPRVTMNIVGASPQTALPDGGIPAATNSTFEIRASNALQAGPTTSQFTVSFP